MILPVVPYGKSILRQKCSPVDADSAQLQTLIDNMWETLYPADGCGLAAVQVNEAINLFIVDSKIMFDNMEPEERKAFFDGDRGICETFINATITHFSPKTWIEYEGCLSIPGMSEEVGRSWSITIEYLDRHFTKHIKTFSGTTARVIQHEFDHTQGKVYIDRLSALRRKLLGKKLDAIASGAVRTKYPMLKNR